MTELELLLMKVAGLSEVESKSLIKCLDSIEENSFIEIKNLLMNIGISEMEANESAELLVKMSNVA